MRTSPQNESRRRRAGAVALLGLAAGGGLSACGSDADSGLSGAPPAPAGTVVVVGDDRLRFDAESYTAPAGEIPFVLRNQGALPHTLLIEDSSALDLEVRGAGDTAEGTATLEPGTYELFCDVPGHRATMQAELIVE